LIIFYYTYACTTPVVSLVASPPPTASPAAAPHGRRSIGRTAPPRRVLPIYHVSVYAPRLVARRATAVHGVPLSGAASQPKHNSGKAISSFIFYLNVNTCTPSAAPFVAPPPTALPTAPPPRRPITTRASWPPRLLDTTTRASMTLLAYRLELSTEFHGVCCQLPACDGTAGGVGEAGRWEMGYFVAVTGICFIRMSANNV